MKAHVLLKYLTSVSVGESEVALCGYPGPEVAVIVEAAVRNPPSNLCLKCKRSAKQWMKQARRKLPGVYDES